MNNQEKQEIEQLDIIVAKTRAKWFVKGQKSVWRKNSSGCTCIIDDNDNIIQVCGAHEDWLAKALKTHTM